MLFLGNLIYIALLLTNAVAILSQDRFLARSALLSPSRRTIGPAWDSRRDTLGEEITDDVLTGLCVILQSASRRRAIPASAPTPR
jgi:hypothetical protein